MPDGIELVMTGRPVPEWIANIADYYSEVKKIKHPFDKGIAARIGVEK
jgi:cob(I)alamin adenosyltransferase